MLTYNLYTNAMLTAQIIYHLSYKDYFGWFSKRKFFIILKAFAGKSHPEKQQSILYPSNNIHISIICVLLKCSKCCKITIPWNAWKTTNFFHNTSVTFEKPDLLAIFCPMSLPYGLRDFGETYIIALNILKAFERVWHSAF